MTRPQHTPGPWHRNIPPATKYAVIFAGRNTHIAVISGGARHGQTLPDAEIEANANLITYAPDLAEALDRLLNWPARFGGERAEDVAFARAAYARAMGEMPDGAHQTTQSGAGPDAGQPQPKPPASGDSRRDGTLFAVSENTSCLSVSPETRMPETASAVSTGKQQRDTLGVTAGETATKPHTSKGHPNDHEPRQ